MTSFRSRTCISAGRRVTFLFISFFLLPYVVRRGGGKFCVIGGLMVTEGHGSPPSLARRQDDGSGWLTVRKQHLKGGVGW